LNVNCACAMPCLEAIRIWVQQISNAIVGLGSMHLMHWRWGLWLPSIQRRWGGLLDTNSYHGIPLTPVHAKVLEWLILDRLMLMERLPHLNQTGRESHAQRSFFSTLEVISQFAQQGEKVYLCFMTFTAQCSTQWKGMGLIKAWYNHPKCKVKVNGQLLLHSLSSEAYFRDLFCHWSYSSLSWTHC